MTSVLHFSPSFMDGFARTCFDQGVAEEDAFHMLKAARAEHTSFGQLLGPLIKFATGPGAPSSAPVASAGPQTQPITGLPQKSTTAPIPAPSPPSPSAAPPAVTPVSKPAVNEPPLPTSAAGNNARAWETWGANPNVAPPLGLKDHNGNQVTGNNQWATPGGGQISATATSPSGQVTARKVTSPYGTGSSTILTPEQFAQRKPGVFTDTVNGKPTQMSFNTFKGMRDDNKWQDMLRNDPTLAAANPMLGSDTHLADGSINPTGEAMQRSLRYQAMQDMPQLAAAPTAPLVAAAPPSPAPPMPPPAPSLPKPAPAALKPHPALTSSPLSPAEAQRNKNLPFNNRPLLGGSTGFVPTAQVAQIP